MPRAGPDADETYSFAPCSISTFATRFALGTFVCPCGVILLSGLRIDGSAGKSRRTSNRSLLRPKWYGVKKLRQPVDLFWRRRTTSASLRFRPFRGNLVV